jgi:sugar O-acyltransferase (sialic acid O-acetyltransferase NeuD family)
LVKKVFTMQIHLLGYSEATLSRIFDVLADSNQGNEIIIVQNMPVAETIKFCPPGMSFKKISCEQWQFDAATGRCFPAVMNPQPKKQLFDFFQERCGVQKSQYCNLIHPRAVVSSTAALDTGCMVEPGAVVCSFAQLGFGVYVNRGSTIGHHVRIGEYSMTGPGVHIAGHCDIGEGVKLGIGAVVFDHVRIGDHTIVGGGSVVTKDLPAGVIAWGNPCKVIKSISLHEA